MAAPILSTRLPLRVWLPQRADLPRDAWGRAGIALIVVAALGLLGRGLHDEPLLLAMFVWMQVADPLYLTYRNLTQRVARSTAWGAWAVDAGLRDATSTLLGVPVRLVEDGRTTTLVVGSPRPGTAAAVTVLDDLPAPQRQLARAHFGSLRDGEALVGGEVHLTSETAPDADRLLRALRWAAEPRIPLDGPDPWWREQLDATDSTTALSAALIDEVARRASGDLDDRSAWRAAFGGPHHLAALIAVRHREARLVADLVVRTVDDALALPASASIPDELVQALGAVSGVQDENRILELLARVGPTDALLAPLHHLGGHETLARLPTIVGTWPLGARRPAVAVLTSVSARVGSRPHGALVLVEATGALTTPPERGGLTQALTRETHTPGGEP